MTSPLPCRGCKAPITILADADGGKKRPYDAAVLDGSRLPAHVTARPVFGGQAWRPADLAEHFMLVRDCSRADAEQETRDVPWLATHTCSPIPGDTAATRGTDEED